MRFLCSNELHEQLEQMTIDYKMKMVVHALIECGRVTELKCQYAACKKASRDFSNETTALQLSVDHIVPHRRGGSHRPDNLQLLHRGCNSVKAHHEDADRGPTSRVNRRSHRGPNISAALTGRMSEASKRGWETRRRNRN